MGTIYKRKDSKYFWIKYTLPNGRTKHESSKSIHKRTAQKLLQRREGDIASGKPSAAMYGKVTFQELAEGLLIDYMKKQRKTVAKAESLIRLHLGPYFGHLAANEITTDLVNAYVAKRLGEDASYAYINRELSALKRMYSLALRSTPPKVAQAPCIEKLAEKNVRTGFLTDEQFLELKENLPDYLRAPVEFAFCYGWRKSEIFNLTWDKVDLKKGTVRIERGDTKNERAKQVYLFPEILGLFRTLRNQPESLKTPYVFHRQGEHIKGFYGAWRAACRRAGIPGMLFHDLRRTAARNMRQMGLSEKEIMEIAGWKTRTVFDRYNIVDDKDQIKAAALMSEKAKALTVTLSLRSGKSGEEGEKVRSL